MKTKCLGPERYVVAVSLMIAGVLLACYSARANSRRGGMQNGVTMTAVAPAERDRDPEYLAKRREFAKRFFGTGPEGVSPRAYIEGLTLARALPASPLMENRRFTPFETLERERSWWNLLPIHPIENSYGGKAGAMVHAMALDPFNANIVYTGSFGGLAKTTDGGVTWQYLSDAWISQSVSAIAVDPNMANAVYAGTGREDYGPYSVGLYRSFDGGVTWTRPLGNGQFAGTYVRAIAIDPNASGSELTTTLYVGSTSGLWRSTDSGTTWTQKRQRGIYDVAIDDSSFPSTLFVTDDGGTYRSTDSGSSWTKIHDILLRSHNRVSVVRPTLLRRNPTLYLLGPNDPEHNLYKSTDRGATWIQIPTRCPWVPDVCENQDPPPGPPVCADSCADNHGNIGFQTFAVDPANPRIILAGNLALYRTTDEGTTWSEIGHWWGDLDPRRSLHTDQRVIAFSQTIPGVVYGGNDGGVVSSANHGLDWTNLNQNLPGGLLYSVALSANGSMIAGTQDNGAVFSSVGAHWVMVAGGDVSHALIDPSDSTWAYYVIYERDSFTRLNTQTGENRNISPAELEEDNDCAFFPTFSMNSSSPKHLLAACQRVVRTLDATASTVTWTRIGQPLAESHGHYVTAAAEAPSNPDVIYAITDENTVFVTSNAGEGNSAAWIQAQTGNLQGIHAVTVHPTDPRTAYLSCNSGVYKTTDLGTTWIRQGVPDLVYHDVVIDPTNAEHIFAASNAGVFASTDGGVTWGNMSDGIPTGMAVSSLSFNATNRNLAAATFGRGVYTLNFARPVQPRPIPRPRR